MFLAWKELRYYKTKYGLITGILVLLTFMVLFLGGLANGLAAATSSTIKNSDGAFYAISEDSDEIITRSELSKAQVDEIDAFYGEVTAFNLQRTAISKTGDDTKIDCTYLAIDTSSFMMVNVIDGSETLGENEIILNNTFIDEDIAIGDTIKDVASDTPLKVVGFTKGESYGHSSVGVMTIGTYQAMRSKLTNNPEVPYNAVAIKDADADATGFADNESIAVLSKNDIISKIPGHAQEQTTIRMILYVLLVVSAVILGIFFYVITIQRLGQFGTLKAIGTSMKTISAMIFWQVLIISGCSVLIGDLLTFGMAAMMPAKMPFALTVLEACFISALFVIISVVSSLFTLIKVSKVDPIIAIGGND